MQHASECSVNHEVGANALPVRLTSSHDPRNEGESPQRTLRPGCDARTLHHGADVARPSKCVRPERPAAAGVSPCRRGRVKADIQQDGSAPREPGWVWCGFTAGRRLMPRPACGVSSHCWSNTPSSMVLRSPLRTPRRRGQTEWAPTLSPAPDMPSPPHAGSRSDTAPLTMLAFRYYAARGGWPGGAPAPRAMAPPAGTGDADGILLRVDPLHAGSGSLQFMGSSRRQL